MRSVRRLAAAAARRLLAPLVPSRHRLPFSYWLHRLGGTCGPELRHLDKLIVSGGTAIDVGANEGLYTYVLSKRFKRVYAFEINSDVAGPITQYNPGNITLFTCGLSSTPRTARFYIPVMANCALAGWGSLDRYNLPGAETLIEKDVQVRPLDEFGIASVDFVKIDVEGHEMEVLEGAASTIGQSRPIVLIEVKESNLQAVNSWFLERNFRHYRIQDFLDRLEEGADHIYVPIERLSLLGLREYSSSSIAVPVSHGR